MYVQFCFMQNWFSNWNRTRSTHTMEHYCVFDSRPECHFVRSFIFSFLVIRRKTFHCLFQCGLLRERPRRFYPFFSVSSAVTDATCGVRRATMPRRFPNSKMFLITITLIQKANVEYRVDIFLCCGGKWVLRRTRKWRIEVKRLECILEIKSGEKPKICIPTKE